MGNGSSGVIQYSAENGGSRGYPAAREGQQTSPNAFTAAQLAFIKRKMAERGYRDMSELARAMKASHATVSKWFTGQRGASRPMQERLASAIGEPWPTTFLDSQGGVAASTEYSEVRTGAQRDRAGVLWFRDAGGDPRDTYDPFYDRTREVTLRQAVSVRPVYRGGSEADLSLVGTVRQPTPWNERFPPLDLVHVLLPDGYVLAVTDEELAGRLPVPLLEGDLCWVVPAHYRAFSLGSLVAAHIAGASKHEDQGNRIRTVDVDEEGIQRLYAEPTPGKRRQVQCKGFRVLGPVVRIERHLSPD